MTSHKPISTRKAAESPHAPQVAKSPGRCIFCGGPGLTKEHVLPDWLKAIFPRQPTDTHTHGNAAYIDLPSVGYVPLPSRRRRQGQVGTRQVRVVCRSCNGGWLSRLEKETKPLLTQLIHGRRFTLQPDDQRLVASWIAKTCMTAEYIEPNEVSIPQSERTSISHTLEPPPHWSIWIAAYLGEKWQAGGIFHHAVGMYPPPQLIWVGIKNTQYTVIGVGRLLATAASSSIEGLTFEFQNEESSDLRRIWPPIGRNIDWPPPRYLTDRGADAVAANFSRFLGIEAPFVGT